MSLSESLSPSANGICEITTTLPTQSDAERIAEHIVQQKLAACVQISGPIQSCYFWKDSVQNDQEFSLRIKTTRRALEAVLSFVRSQHPYELPELLWRDLQSSPEYAKWVDESCVTPRK